MKLIITRRSDDYHVCLEGHPEIWECGKTALSAVGKWFHTHGNEHGVTIEWPKMRVKIIKCSESGAWWEAHIGETVEILWTDSYGHWTRDTGPLRCSQWIKPEDTQPV